VEATLVKGVSITNRKDGKGNRLRNVGVHVGDQPAVMIGKLLTNPKCAIFLGPSDTGRVEVIMCTQPMVGRYLQVQMRESSRTVLFINEIEVFS
jgi:hypothetical protein